MRLELDGDVMPNEGERSGFARSGRTLDAQRLTSDIRYRSTRTWVSMGLNPIYISKGRVSAGVSVSVRAPLHPGGSCLSRRRPLFTAVGIRHFIASPSLYSAVFTPPQQQGYCSSPYHTSKVPLLSLLHYQG